MSPKGRLAARLLAVVALLPMAAVACGDGSQQEQPVALKEAAVVGSEYVAIGATEDGQIGLWRSANGEAWEIDEDFKGRAVDVLSTDGEHLTVASRDEGGESLVTITEVGVDGIVTTEPLPELAAKVRSLKHYRDGQVAVGTVRDQGLFRAAAWRAEADGQWLSVPIPIGFPIASEVPLTVVVGPEVLALGLVQFPDHVCPATWRLHGDNWSAAEIVGECGPDSVSQFLGAAHLGDDIVAMAVIDGAPAALRYDGDTWAATVLPTRPEWTSAATLGVASESDQARIVGTWTSTASSGAVVWELSDGTWTIAGVQSHALYTGFVDGHWDRLLGGAAQTTRTRIVSWSDVVAST